MARDEHEFKESGICTTMTRIILLDTNVNHCRFFRLLLIFSLLWILSGCRSASSLPEFPPTEETVQTVVGELGWTLDPEGTQSWAENHILYTIETENQMKISVSCALVGESRFLTETCAVMFLPSKPQFVWEDWKEAVSLAEKLYGGFSEGEFYQILSEQAIPEPEIPSAELSTPAGHESLIWEAESSAGYGRVWWSISAGAVEHVFPSPVIHDWRITLSISLYESKEVYENMNTVS